MGEKAERYYGVNQLSNGHEYRWIFEESVLKEKMYGGGEVPEYDDMDIGFPIGGSNRSSTWVKLLNGDEDIKGFLTGKAEGPDSEDPTLVEIAEYLLTVDNDYGSCTDVFMKKFGLNYGDLSKTDDGYSRGARAEKMLSELEFSGKDDEILDILSEMGYQYDRMDYGFYGCNKDLTFNDLEALWQAVCH